MVIWKTPQNVLDLIKDVKQKHHHPRLEDATFSACFEDSKSFVNNRINLGKTTKFSEFNKLWQENSCDFCIILCTDVWHSLLIDSQREALIDLHLTRCGVDFIPEVIKENGKKKVVKDEFGRIQYTNQIKLDENGNPKWRIEFLDLVVFTKNVIRYGTWLEELIEFKKVLKNMPESE